MYGIVHHFPGLTKEQYDEAVAASHPEGGAALPPGQLVHSAGPSADGWVVVAIYDTRENWESFRDGVLMPAMARGLSSGPVAPPEETTFEVDVHLTA